MGGKYHPPNNAAQKRKLLIWSLGILLPFLVLFTIFPSGTSFYKPSYNRIVVSQLQVPSSRLQSSLHESAPSSGKADTRNDDGDKSNLALMKARKKKSKADSLPKVSKKQSKIADESKKMMPSVIEVDQSSTRKSKTENYGMKIDSSNTEDEGDLSRLEAMKQNDADDEGRAKNHGDGGHGSKSFSTKAKKQNDEDEGDHLSRHTIKKQKDEGESMELDNAKLDLSSKKVKKQNNFDEYDHLPGLKTKMQTDGEKAADVLSIDDELDLPLKKAKKQKGGDGDKPEVSADLMEKGIEEQEDEKSQTKKKRDELYADKKGTKRGKAMHNTEETPFVELDGEFSVSGKAEKQEQQNAKKGKVKHSRDEFSATELDEENTLTGKRKAAEYDNGLPTMKLSRGRKADLFTNKEELFVLGEADEGSSSEVTTTKQSIKKTMVSTLDAENEVFLSGKKSSSKEEVDVDEDGFPKKVKESSLTKEAEEDADDAFTKKEKKISLNDKVMEDVDEDGFTRKGKKSSLKKENENDDGFTKKGKTSSLKNKVVEDADEDSFTTKRKKNRFKKEGEEDADEDSFNKKRNENNKDEELDEDGLMDKHAESGKMGDISNVLLLKTGYEEAFPKAKKKKRVETSSLEENLMANGSTKSDSSDADEQDGAIEEVVSLGKRKSFKTKAKDSNAEREYSIVDQKDVVDADLPSSKDDVDQKASDDDDSMDHFSSHTGKSFPYKKLKLPAEECRYSKGRWTMDSDYPPYMDSTCPWKSINDGQDCKTTQKMITWRWQPSECDMERFKAKSFLKSVQGKSMAFVGDKMVKAQVKSLICLLAKVETPTLLYNSKANRSASWHFRSWDVTLSLVWSPYLVQQTSEDRYTALRLDRLDTRWTQMVPTLDVLILGVGTHFVQPSIYMVKDDVVGCYSCQDLSTHIDITKLKELSLYSGFRATMRSSIMGIGGLPGYKGFVLFLQPFGFEGSGNYYDIISKMKEIQVQELQRAQSKGIIHNQAKMEVLYTNLDSVGKHDPIKLAYSPTCWIPSPLADAWNQVLQHTLTRTPTLELDTY